MRACLLTIFSSGRATRYEKFKLVMNVPVGEAFESNFHFSYGEITLASVAHDTILKAIRLPARSKSNFTSKLRHPRYRDENQEHPT